MDVDTPGQPRDSRYADPLVGRALDGRYRIGPRIARGGMASVHEATDLRLDRVVAVKVMHPGLGDDDEFAARFVREARAAARLSHPHVVGVFDQGDDEGTVFLVMEYVPGHTLRDVIRKEAPMSPTRALSLIDPVLSALAAAHRAGLIHRDVKPENVLIADDGRVKVADFGLAKAISSDTQHTATGGVLIGTVSYLAPELVIDGKSDARADVYAAGVVLYEMLTGRKPHEGESPIAIAYKHVHEDVPPPSEAVPDLPPYVDALVARATSRDRNNRPADAGVFLHQVHRVRQALTEGVTDDPELTADLQPSATTALRVPDDLALAIEEPSETREMAAAGREHTATLRPITAPVPVPARSSPPVRAGSITSAPRRRSRKRLTLFLAALLLAVAVGAGAWWFGEGRYTPTPGVLGLTQSAAQQELEDAGLSGEVGDGVYSETVPEGKVVSTDPDPGDNVLDGGTVTLVLSLGKERYAIPTLRGRSEDEAQDALGEAHLTFGRSIGKFSDDFPAGTVLGSDPAPGVEVKPDTAVDLLVSKGPKPINVPDFTGKNGDKAESELTDLGFDVQRSDEFDDTVPEGQVVSQSPNSDTLYKGDEVELVVSKGPELIAVPNVIGRGYQDAKQTLEAAGFVVEIAGTPNFGGVYATDPPAGTEARKGSTVSVFVI